jgi:hypothetical protein
MAPPMPQFKEIVYRVSTDLPRPFTAGLIVHRDVDAVVRAAPILKFMLGWKRDRMRDYCKAQGWQLQVCFGDETDE